MNLPQQGIYQGEVVHVRVRPKRHILSLKIFQLFINLCDLETTTRRLSLFSYNRFNLFSINDKKWGARDGTPLLTYIRGLAEKSCGPKTAQLIYMLCFPALLGRVFNPLTTYYCYNAEGALQCLVRGVEMQAGSANYPIFGTAREQVR